MEDVLAHNNRIDYGEALMPDEGWTTSWAIGTTFSLDLEVLLTVPLALFHGKDLCEVPDLSNLRSHMLDSLEQVRDKMFVFVQQNNIKAMKKYSLLMSFLDQNIWEVHLAKADRSFHPKLWLIRYEKNDTFRYRLIVMSRNITSATDFDISAVLEGECCQDNISNNTPLISMMSYLLKNRGKRTDIIAKQLKIELKKIKFTAPAPFQEDYYEFYPQQMDGDDICPLLTQNFRYNHLMVVSPFLDDNSLEQLRKNSDKKPVLISRFEQLEKCNPKTLKDWDCYHWASSIADEDNSDTECNISLHAKIYIMETQRRHQGGINTDRKIWNYWYLGSTNCTTAGMNKNYEALLQLRSDNDKQSVINTFNTLLKSNLVIKYNIPTDEDYTSAKEEQDRLKKMEQRMRKCVFSLSNLKITGTVLDSDNTGIFDVSLKCDKQAWLEFQKEFAKDFKITAHAPAGTNETWELMNSHCAVFHHIQCQELSRFIKITVKLKGQKAVPPKSFLIDTKINIPQLRYKRVMEQILNSDEKILRYLLFILDNDMPDKDQLLIGKSKHSQSRKEMTSPTWEQYALPVYERLLLAASRDKAALKEFISKVERLKGDNRGKKPILNAAFFNMVNLFKKYAR